MATAAPTCPFLGLHDDPHSVQATSSEDNSCFASKQARRVNPSYQNLYCLTRTHVQCPLFQSANALVPSARTVVLEPGPRVPQPAHPPEADQPLEELRPSGWRARIIPLAAVLAVLFAIGYGLM